METNNYFIMLINTIASEEHQKGLVYLLLRWPPNLAINES